MPLPVSMYEMSCRLASEILANVGLTLEDYVALQGKQRTPEQIERLSRIQMLNYRADTHTWELSDFARRLLVASEHWIAAELEARGLPELKKSLDKV